MLRRSSRSRSACLMSAAEETGVASRATAMLLRSVSGGRDASHHPNAARPSRSRPEGCDGRRVADVLVDLDDPAVPQPEEVHLQVVEAAPVRAGADHAGG